MNESLGTFWEGIAMENKEKLNIFYTSALEAANKTSSEDMRQFSASMEKRMEEFRKQKKEELTSRYQTEAEKLKRDLNRQVSESVTELKRRLNGRQQEKKEALFDMVSLRLKAYRKTEEYNDYLTAKIRMAKEFARQEAVVIYIDPTDQDRKEFLEQACGCSLTVSQQEFGGGIRAVVRSKNVLIDESFQTKLNQEREAYTF